MFEHAKWLWCSKRYAPNSYGHFKKEFELKQTKKSTLFISAHNQFKLYINGHLVSGLVTPAPTNLVSKPYLVYDVSNYLKLGQNTIEVVVLYLGGTGQNYRNGIPGFILELHTDNQVLISDTSWVSISNTPYMDGMPFQQNRRITALECYDSTRLQENPIYVPVVILEGYKAYHKQFIPEGKVYESFLPTLIHQSDIVSVFDCGRILSGFVSLKVNSKIPQTIEVRYSEDLIDGRVKHNVANESSETYLDRMIVSNQPIEHTFDFTYKAFRYFEVTYEKDSLLELEVKALIASTDIHIEGDLHSDSYPIVNRLFEVFKNTQRNNTLGLLVDCPHREQAQYLGDSTLQAEAMIYNVLERKELLEKVLKDFSESQYDDGTFPFVSPGSTDSDDFSLKIPEYDLYFIELLKKRYEIDLDTNILERYYPNALKLIEHYISKIDSTGLVVKNTEWHISDWPYPTVDHEGQYLTFENMLFHEQLKTFIELYPKSPQIGHFQMIKDKLFKSIQTHLKEGFLFKDHESSHSIHPGVQATALEYGFVLEPDVEAVLDYIVNAGFQSSIILGRPVVKTLFKHGRVSDALKYLFGYPKGWGAILNQNQLTMWEGFDDIESHSHAWGLYPVRFIQNYVLGIHMHSKEKDTYLIEPMFTDEIKDLRGSVVTEKGILSFKYLKESTNIHFYYSIPEGLKVTFKFQETEKALLGSGSFSVDRG